MTTAEELAQVVSASTDVTVKAPLLSARLIRNEEKSMTRNWMYVSLSTGHTLTNRLSDRRS
jgi:hypothetical protein